MKLIISEIIDNIPITNIDYIQILIKNGNELYINVSDIETIPIKLEDSNLEIVFPEIYIYEFWLRNISPHNIDVTLSSLKVTSLLCFGITNIKLKDILAEELVLHKNEVNISLVNSDIEVLHTSYLKSVIFDDSSNIDKSYITINKTSLIHTPNICIDGSFCCPRKITEINVLVLNYMMSI